MYFDTAEEYDAEIAAVRLSISRTLESQKYAINKNGVAGESQRVTLPELRSYLQALQSERAILAGGDSAPVTRIYAASGRGN